jgi:hypothetical protein
MDHSKRFRFRAVPWGTLYSKGIGQQWDILKEQHQSE